MNRSYSAWSDDLHAKVFDQMSAYPLFLLRKRFESFNEMRLLKHNHDSIVGGQLAEVGCATGELFRYVSHYMKKFSYKGFDLSKPAVARAKHKYPGGAFHVIESIDEVLAENEKYPVVFCRDVVVHQEEPFVFLDKLLALTEECLVMRLRTRDVGATELDVEKSCQRHYGMHWVPYMVLNTDEMIERISRNPRVERIEISRRYEVLGGFNGRYLPKELYYSDAKGAETGVLVRLGERDREGDVKIVYDDMKDGPRFSLAEKVIEKGMCSLKLGKLPSAHPENE